MEQWGSLLQGLGRPKEGERFLQWDTAPPTTAAFLGEPKRENENPVLFLGSTVSCHHACLREQLSA